MAGERSPVDYDTRQRILKMRKGGATYDEIAKTFGVSKSWISRFLAKRDAEVARLRGPLDEQGAAAGPAPAPPPSDQGEEHDTVAPAGETTATGRNIGELEEELRTLYRLANQSEDPLERAKISATISGITARLAALRRDEAKARPGAADDLVKRAGQQAADKLRKLVEEAIGEALPEDETA